MRLMKILYIYKDYYPVLGGIENHLRQLAEGMMAKGHQVEVLVTSLGRKGQREIIANVPVTKAGRLVNLASAPISLTLFTEVYRRVFSRKTRPDIIHLQFPYPIGELAWLSSLLLIWPRRNRPKSVLSYQSDIVRQRRLLKLYAPFLKLLLREVDVILPSSTNYIASSQWLQPVKQKCHVVPLGIDYQRFAAPRPEQAAAIRNRYAPASKPLILFVGRLRYYKGVQYLIQALPLLQTSNARLLIIGTGPMEAELRSEVARLKLEKSVEFLGEIGDEDLPSYYQAADIFVLPACERSEAFGLVQAEAMAAGCPIISTELGTGTSYVNQNEVSGLVVPPADPAALAIALDKLLSNPELRRQYGANAQKRIQEEFSLEKMLERVEQIYRSLLAT